MKSTTWLRRSLFVVALLMLVGILATGCGRPRRVTVVHVPKGKVVVVKKGHAHTARCGHYRHNGKWYLIKGHKHGKRCGHAKVKGVWIIR